MGVQQQVGLPFLIMYRLALSHAFNCGDLFQNFPIKKLKISKAECTKIYSDGSRRSFAAHVFKRALKMVINDIIENNVIFRLPGVGSSKGYIQMKRYTGDEFKRAFRNGKWRDVDFIKSDFQGYQLTFLMASPKRPDREKPIYLGKNQRNIITEYTNKGRQY